MIITKKDLDYNDLNTLLKINIIGDGSEIFDYSLPTPNTYTRYDEQSYVLEYALKGVFWTKTSNDFLNDILLRFNLSMKISNIQTKTIGKKETLHELKSFSSSSNLESLRKSVFIPNTNKYEDSVFWGLKLFVEHYIKLENFIPYSTLENYAFNHYIDIAKDRSTLKAKCRSIWRYYEAREWQPQITYNKKDKGEVMATRLQHIENLAKQKKAKTEHKIVSAIDFLQGENKKITAKLISEYTKLNKNTLTKYSYLWK